jgi:DNA-binding CsgD family transcriptional regulator
MPQISLNIIWLLIIIVGIIIIINAFVTWAIQSHNERLRLRDDNLKLSFDKNQKDNLLQTILFTTSFKPLQTNNIEPVKYIDISGYHNGKLLSDGELQVLNILVKRSCDQKSTKNKDIAEDLYLSKFTVRNHIANMLSKTGCSDRTQLVSWAMTNKIIELNNRV